MPYQYLTFSDLYEEEVRSSAPSSPTMGAASLSPVFLLPTPSPSHTHSASSSSYRHHHHHHHHSQSHSQSRHSYHHSRCKGDVHDHAMLKTLTQDSDEVACPTHSTSSPSSSCASSISSSSSTSSLHLDFLRVFKRKSIVSRKASKHSTDSAFSTPASSTPASSRRSSFTSHGLASLHPVSAASSANTSPAISRQVTKISDYDALLQRTARQEEADEQRRQTELQAYFNQAAHSGLSLRRFSNS